MITTPLDICKQFINTLLLVNVSFIQRCPSEISDLLAFIFKNFPENLIDKSFFTTYLFQLNEKKIYHITDRFLIHYMVVPFDEGDKMMIVGPYLSQEPTNSFCEKVLSNNHLPISMLLPLQYYYHTLPIAQNSTVISATSIAFKQLYGADSNLSYTHHILCDKDNATDLTYLPEDNKNSTMKLLEDRYAAENKLLLEIQHGNLEGAFLAQREFCTLTKGISRSNDPIRSEKTLCYMSNTLFRKAVERAAVHPIYIDILSSHLARLIEDTHSIQGLSDLRSQMVKDYCHLVNSHTLKDYSPLIRKTINYININLSTELHLKDIAESVEVSPNYLSNLFNKETKQSMTHFIHSKRIHKAAELLQSSELSIQTIAFYVGYNDMNYFTKLFKKQTGTTPSKFKQPSKEVKI